jgi:hypothetical protein
VSASEARGAGADSTVSPGERGSTGKGDGRDQDELVGQLERLAERPRPSRRYDALESPAGSGGVHTPGGRVGSRTVNAMTSWADVGLTLAGAPVGAAIALLGVGISNRYSYRTHRELLASQEQQQRERLEFDLRSDHLQRTLARRAEIYEKLLEVVDEVDKFSRWAEGTNLPDNVSVLSNEDLLNLWLSARKLRYEVDVHCSRDVRAQWRVVADGIDSASETSESATWRALIERAEALRVCVIEAAVLDRTTGMTRDGLGGM